MKNTLLLIAVLVSFSGISQSKGIIAKEYTHFSIHHKKDTIDFVVADTVFPEIKPILLFCQGSQPVPLFLDFGDQGIFPTALSNFDLSEMKKQFYVVVISMPKTPIIVGQDHLNKSYNYIVDTTNERSYSRDYLEADRLDNYVLRGNQVIKFLRK